MLRREARAFSSPPMEEAYLQYLDQWNTLDKAHLSLWAERGCTWPQHVLGYQAVLPQLLHDKLPGWEKIARVRLCFSCAVLCTAPTVMLLNGPLAIVATVSCSTKIPKICLHLMKLVPWESEQLGFTLGTSLSTHRCFQVKTALHPLQKAGSWGFEFTPPLMDSSCTSVRTSTCGTDLRYIH